MAPRLADFWRSHPVTVLLIAGLGGAALVIALVWPITDLIAAHDVGLISAPQRAAHLQTARESVRTQLFTLLAGLGAAGALIYTARNFTLSRRTVALTEQGQVTDRYTKAIDQLGSDKALDVRIGGIYALERVGRDSPRDHPTVMEVLAAFILEHSQERWPPAEPGAGSPPKRTTRPDVQAAATVIGRRNREYDRGQINLQEAQLPEVSLIDANLSGVTLIAADLTGANLGTANLTGTLLFGADLSEAVLIAANLAGAVLLGANLTDAKLSGADLSGSDLRDARLTNAELARANFTNANLDGTNFTGAYFSEDSHVPEGWARDPDSGRLKRASEDMGVPGLS